MSNIVTLALNKPYKTWPIRCDGYFKEKISHQLMQDDIPAESVDSIFENAVEILTHCPNPYLDEAQAKTGIMIGKVQSGKTSNFIALTALAFDNEYKITIVLGGNKNNLLDQNASRIESYYQEVPKDKLSILTTNKNAKLITAPTIKSFLLGGRNVLIVGLKHQKHIDQIAEIFNDPYLRDVPTLIIDDEGDQATLNTKKNKQTEMSVIYNSVISLKSKIRRHCFASITATPQANILIETWDALSPDFGVLIYPGENYCGLPEFHGTDEEIHIKSIPDTDPDILTDPFIPSSFYDALSVFFVGGALRRYRGDIKNHAMLIHPSQKKYDQQQVLDKVIRVMNDWVDISRNIENGIDDIAYKQFHQQIKKGCISLQKDGVLLPSFEELQPYVIKCILDWSPPLLCNSDEDASVNSAHYKFNIVLGGNMVERGITIKGLAVTYITRRAKGKANVDNTEQRARWFGYKRDYLDVCRVYTTDVIRNDFKAI
ncbi:MAG: Z1 domain-containing protein, partial [Suipraeoptans sp.]